LKIYKQKKKEENANPLIYNNISMVTCTTMSK